MLHRTPDIARTNRSALPTRFALGALATGVIALTLTGCKGHGNYTSAAVKHSEQRLGAIKAGAEFETARQQFFSGDLDKALRTIERAIANAPQVTKSYTLRGRILLERGDYEDAIEALTVAIGMDEAPVDAYFNRAIAFERVNRWQDAIEDYSRCRELDPTEPRYLVAAADMLVEMGRVPEAREMLLKGIEAHQHSAGVRRTLGTVALLEGMPEYAARLLREARLLEPKNTGVLEDLARAEMAANRFADAEVVLAQLLAEPNMQARRDLMHMRVHCLIEVNRLVDARTALLALTRDEAGSADRVAWLTLGRVALRLNDLPRLRQSASRLMAIDAMQPDGRLFMAAWQRRRGDLDGALRSLDGAIELAPRQSEAWAMRSVVLKDLGRDKESAESLRTAQAMRSVQMNTRSGGSLAGVVEDAQR